MGLVHTKYGGAVKAIFVISVEMNEPEDAPTIMEHLNPTSIPFFAGEVRIALDDVAKAVEDWLDE